MKVFITGATGFIGSSLARRLLAAGHEVLGSARGAPPAALDHPRGRFVAADTTRPGAWQELVAGCDAVFNLAGESIYGRWSAKRKRSMTESRTATTRQVAAALASGAVLVSASGVGYYGDRGEELLTEEAAAGRGVLVGLATAWEAEALAAARAGRRVVVARLGVVLGRGGGALAQMVPAFKSFLGGPIGDGRQWFSWIHLEDLLSAFEFVLADPDIGGPVNFAAPNPVRHRELAHALGWVLHRPAIVPTPAFALRLALGEFAEVLLESQRAVPARLLAAGFRFRHPEIAGALASLLAQETPPAAPSADEGGRPAGRKGKK